MRSILLAFFVSLVLCACSRRIEYSSHAAPPRPDAINVNTASVDKLEGLPHIGHTTAVSIVSFREKNGDFRRVEDLLQIRGISEARFSELRPLLKVE